MKRSLLGGALAVAAVSLVACSGPGIDGVAKSIDGAATAETYQMPTVANIHLGEDRETISTSSGALPTTLAEMTIVPATVAPTTVAEVTIVPTRAKPEMTSRQANAVRAARDYLDYSPFSRQGLIDQLEFEDYSAEDATFAVDYVSPDWNEQAAKAAKDYLDYSPFSHQGLIDQLVFEGYTSEQAQYGVEQAGV